MSQSLLSIQEKMEITGKTEAEILEQEAYVREAQAAYMSSTARRLDFGEKCACAIVLKRWPFLRKALAIRFRVSQQTISALSHALTPRPDKYAGPYSKIYREFDKLGEEEFLRAYCSYGLFDELVAIARKHNHTKFAIMR